MLIDFRNPETVAAWVALRPLEHAAQLAGLLALPLWRRFGEALRPLSEAAPVPQ